MEADYYRLPCAKPPEVSPGSFQLCPVGVMAGCCEQFNGLAELYRVAFEQAVAAAQETHPEHRLFAMWN
jgi:hypothetical protein